MDPTLVEHGGLIGMLIAAVWFLNKRNDKLTKAVVHRYDAQLEDVGRRLDDCERDRGELHAQIAQILKGGANE